MPLGSFSLSRPYRSCPVPSLLHQLQVLPVLGLTTLALSLWGSLSFGSRIYASFHIFFPIERFLEVNIFNFLNMWAIVNLKGNTAQ